MILTTTGMAAGDLPVDPSSPEAQRWIDGELAKPEYQTAKPTWFDIASKAVGDWINSLFQGPGGDAGPVLLVVVVLIVAGLIVAAFFIFGRPRLDRRSAAGRALFATDDRRTAAELRASAASAARSDDWVTAVEEQFRAIAQSLHERTIVTVSPGTTASEFAAIAGRAVTAERERLATVARVFDGVRYLDRPATEADYQQLVALDTSLLDARPARLTETLR
ncbi:DUF4129 domain-containing protein [Leifsonia poae]|uniref:DUF4129 domain-containing protein n=1 Tax=Leifsonia poae TaxID=110933 RepID=UPI001CBF5AA2|nr:DUF4129 domain-containing protein [Leifsonia poae]